MLVMIFIVLFVSLLGVTWRRVGSALRVASARDLQVQRDEGSLHALAKAMRLLENGIPAPADSPYVCGVVLETPAGSRSYTVTFTLVSGTEWSVHCRPTPSGESPPLMPDTFAPMNP